MPDTRRIQYSEPKRSRRKTILLITLILLSAAVLTACIPGDGRATPSKPGLLLGVGLARLGRTHLTGHRDLLQ